jgi:hypothetical protein
MTPELSVYQAGEREPNPALPVQFSVLIAIGCGALVSPAVARAAA